MAFGCRRIAHDVVRDAAVGDLVGALLHLHGRHRGHRLDALDVHRRKLLDKRQNGVELALKVLDLVLRDRNAGEMGDTADSGSVDRHGSGQGRSKQGKKVQPLYQKGRYHSVPKLTIRTDFITLELAVSVRVFNTDRWVQGETRKATTRT